MQSASTVRRLGRYVSLSPNKIPFAINATRENYTHSWLESYSNSWVTILSTGLIFCLTAFGGMIYYSMVKNRLGLEFLVACIVLLALSLGLAVVSIWIRGRSRILIYDTAHNELVIARLWNGREVSRHASPASEHNCCVRRAKFCQNPIACRSGYVILVMVGRQYFCLAAILSLQDVNSALKSIAWPGKMLRCEGGAWISVTVAGYCQHEILSG